MTIGYNKRKDSVNTVHDMGILAICSCSLFVPLLVLPRLHLTYPAVEPLQFFDLGENQMQLTKGISGNTVKCFVSTKT